MTALLVAVSVAAGAETGIPLDLQQAMRERQSALETGDAAAWDRLTSADFTLGNAEGKLVTKAERLAALKKQGPRAARGQQQDQVQLYGNTAVQRVLNEDGCVLQVWVRQPQGWQVVATQLTNVAKK